MFIFILLTILVLPMAGCEWIAEDLRQEAEYQRQHPVSSQEALADAQAAQIYSNMMRPRPYGAPGMNPSRGGCQGVWFGGTYCQMCGSQTICN